MGRGPGARGRQSIDDGSNFVNAFAGGNIGMAGVGNFASGQYSQNDHPDLNFGVFHIPGVDGGAASFGGGDVIAIPSGTEHVEEAWRFIEWTMSEEPQIEIYAKNSQIPVRLALVDNKYFEGDERQATAASALGSGTLHPTPLSTTTCSTTPMVPGWRCCKWQSLTAI